MYKHTPGPWVWKTDTRSYGAHYRDLAGLDANVMNYYDYEGLHFEGDHETVDANARLIAAAPDLLEALNAVVAFIEGQPNAFEPFCLVREAIGKATGVKND